MSEIFIYKQLLADKMLYNYLLYMCIWHKSSNRGWSSNKIRQQESRDVSDCVKRIGG